MQWALCLSSAFSLLHINDTQRQSCICRICVIELPRHAQTLSLSHTLPFSWGHLFGVFPLSFTGCHIKVRGRSDGREKRANRYEILPYCTNDKLRRAAHVIFMPFPFVGSLFFSTFFPFYPSSTCIDAPSSTETWLLNRLFGCIAIKGGSKSREAFQSINGSFWCSCRGSYSIAQAYSGQIQLADIAPAVVMDWGLWKRERERSSPSSFMFALGIRAETGEPISLVLFAPQ